MFGQLSNALGDVWVGIALREEERVRAFIDAMASKHPFEIRYHRIAPVDWESCAAVLERDPQLEVLRQGWR